MRSQLIQLGYLHFVVIRRRIAPFDPRLGHFGKLLFQPEDSFTFGCGSVCRVA